PYAYFSRARAGNDYNPYATTTPANAVANDCAAITPTAPQPYFVQQGTTRNYINPDTFQILSAGKNWKYGTGGAFTPTQGTTDANGVDDLSNFSKANLGGPVSN